MSFRSGPCTALYAPGSKVGGSPTPTYAALSLTESGFRIRNTNHMAGIYTDLTGGPDGFEADGVQLGHSTMIEVTLVEYDLMKAAAAAFGPIDDPFANVGKLMSSLAGPLAIVPKAGTPNATEIGVGKTRIFYSCVPVTDWEYLLGSGLNRGPMTFKAFPDSTNGGKYFTDATAPTAG